MRLRSLVCTITLLAAGAQGSAAQAFTRPDSIAALAAPVVLDTAGRFQARFVRVGDDVYIGGQPTERALRELREQGVTTVVNLRTPEEMQRAVPFDEEALVKSLGMRYVYLPVRGTGEYPYSPATVAAFAEALHKAEGKVLLHCTIAWRASHLWAAYLIEHRKVPVEQALTHTRAINLMDDRRIGTGATQPIELFLGRPVPGLRRPER